MSWIFIRYLHDIAGTLEGEMLATGRLTLQQAANRQLLRDAMPGAGFAGIKTDWWHVDCGDRDAVRACCIRA